MRRPWGHVCSRYFPGGISYSVIVPAVWFTDALDLLLAPMLLLMLYPLARRAGLFWREMPNQVRQRRMGEQRWTWESGLGWGMALEGKAAKLEAGVPLHIVIGATMVSLLALVFAPGYLTLNSATKAADQLVGRLHQEISGSIKLRLDAYMEPAPRDAEPAQRAADIGKLLARLPIAEQGLAMLVDADGKPIAGTRAVGDPTVVEAVAGLRSEPGQGARFSIRLPLVAP